MDNLYCYIDLKALTLYIFLAFENSLEVLGKQTAQKQEADLWIGTIKQPRQ